MYRIAFVLLMFVLAPSAMADEAATIPASADAAQAQQITMFVLPQCGYCERAREWMRERQLTWSERDISGSEAALREFKSLGGQGTPLIVVGDARIAGFQPDRMQKVLAGAASP